MKKIVLCIICLLYGFTVKADVIFNLDCPNNETYIDKELLCELKVNNDTMISNISFDYDTNVNVDFIENNNIVQNDNGKVFISYENPLEAGDNLILKIKLTSEKSINTSILLKNIKVDNDLKIDDITKNIIFMEDVVLSSNNKISNITVEGKSIDHFNPDINRYENIIISKPVVFIDVKGQDSKATVTGVGSKFFKAGIPTEVNIMVTSEDGNTNIYTLVITYVKEVIKSSDATIGMIELYDKEKKLDFTFDKEKSDFRIKIDGNIEKVLVKATLNNDKAFFQEGYEPKEYNLNYGDNIIELRTQSENGDTKVYTIHVERADNRSSNNTLEELIINDIKINLEKDLSDYEVIVPYDTLKSNIHAKSNNKAKVIYKDINLKEGNNKLTIKVIAENKKEREYRINIIREEKVDIQPDIVEENKIENLLENIKIEGYEFTFDKNIYEYDLTINKDDNSLNFKIEPENADVTILNNKNLTNNSTIIIRLKESNEDKNYTINIHKEVVNSNNNSYLIYGIIGLIVILSLIVFIILRKKKK